MNEIKKQRTIAQNRACHLLFKFLSDELNNAGLDIRATLKPDFNLPWTPVLIKEILFRPIIKIMLGKQSTTQLKTDEIDKIYDVIVRELGEKHGFECPDFPSIESLIKAHQNIS